ncbi:MAG TPA: adenylyl-sulfate kinase [Actinophytocola sp.]|uniref:adenylyl-sulfate kinase n=1 Tax=Actinophytocola sp. TaxID=1872138 RepID=UPI002DDDAF64|nr:adenylyl-sulfate kinase [Actinophytocola sp.]HEV2777851.1 adenylyl-sulfate kinase [Actinophytocola sp.]
MAARAEPRKNCGLLRFITCGSVDDGKSTLIGRLLYESRQLYSDQLAALERDSRRVGGLDFALLVDGLAAEREQGITIDVAYRFFATAARKFVVADTPGHEQYTRNMVTGASTADAAVILVDARKGVLRQTRRHSRLVSLLGIRAVALAVNKLDLVGYSRRVFDDIAAEYRGFAATLGLDDLACIPVSALDGSNVVTRSERTPWYDGPSLLGWLESAEVDDRRAAGPFRMVVQWVNRPGPEFRGFSGRILGGVVRPGDPVRVLPGGQESRVARIVTFDGDLAEAVAGQSVTVVLADELDVARGAILAAAADPPAVAEEFEAHVIWMSERDLLPGRSYLAKIGARTVGVTVNRALRLNEIGLATVGFDAPVAFEPYRVNRDLGGFLVIDRLTNATVGAGLLDTAKPRSTNVRWQALTVDKRMRAALNGHRGCVVWFTGLSGAGKSTIANLVEQELHRDGRHTFILDGDNVRHGLNRDLGFTDADRVENVRRVAEVAGLMVQAGLIVLVAFISPFAAERALARSIVADGEFCEVHVDTPLEVAERRDVKGLYAKARRGELPHFTGIDSPYERPESPELRIDTTVLTPDEAAAAVIGRLRDMGVLAVPN